MEVKEFIDKNFVGMKKDLSKLVSFRSINSDDVLPFGLENRKVLDVALKMMDEKGFSTTNEDYYCGYGQIGQGDKVIGILAHLDVVPEGEGWDNDPFTMKEDNGYVYGRGVSDDKGAVVAAMYALKYLLDENYGFKKRVRLIVGCNEETGSRCIAHYVEKNGHIDYGFTPDGNFPGIFAEKGMVGAMLVAHNSKIKDIKSGQASNVVPKKVVFTLPCACFDLKKLDEYFANCEASYDLQKNGDELILTVQGKAAHASTPDLGINALSYGMCALQYAGFADPLVAFYTENFGLQTHGEKLGYLDIKDEYTDTSINLGGICGKMGEDLVISLDCRFPVKSNTQIAKKPLEAISNNDVAVVIKNLTEPLFFDKYDNKMILALKQAYQQVTGDMASEMEAIGGGTYAKAIHNCIAFGCEFGGEDNHIHDVNEKLSLEAFKKQVEIYVQAIKNLNELD